jgi:hypothetical protein
LFPSIHYQSTGAPSTNRQISCIVLTSFLFFLSQSALIIITTTTVTRNVTAPLAKTIVTAIVIVEIGGTGIGKETGTGSVAGETEMTATDILTIENAQTVVTAIGSVSAVVIATMDARATRKNADGSSRAKTTDVGHTAARTRAVPLAVLAAAVAANANATVAHQIAARPHL